MTPLLLILYAALVILNTLDGFSTLTFVKPDHYKRERNPLARWMFTKLGIRKGIIIAEVLWIGFITMLFLFLWKKPVFNLVLLVLLTLGVVVFSWIVYGNFNYCKALKRRNKDSKVC